MKALCAKSNFSSRINTNEIWVMLFLLTKAISFINILNYNFRIIRGFIKQFCNNLFNSYFKSCDKSFNLLQSSSLSYIQIIFLKFTFVSLLLQVTILLLYFQILNMSNYKTITILVLVMIIVNFKSQRYPIWTQMV